MTPHEERVASMTRRERLIFRLIRRIAVLMGRGKEFDAECNRTATLSDKELNEDIKRKIDKIQAELDK